MGALESSSHFAEVWVSQFVGHNFIHSLAALIVHELVGLGQVKGRDGDAAFGHEWIVALHWHCKGWHGLGLCSFDRLGHCPDASSDAGLCAALLDSRASDFTSYRSPLAGWLEVVDGALGPRLLLRCDLIRLERVVAAFAHIEQAPRLLYRFCSVDLVEGVLGYFSQASRHAAVSTGYGLH